MTSPIPSLIPSPTFSMPSPSQTFSFPSTSEPVFSVSTSEPAFESPNSQTSQNTQSQQKKTGRDPKGNIMILPPVSVEEHIAVQRETKARTILLQSLPEDHMADFHHLDDARDIWLAVKARFGGNDESKKMRKSEFRVSESEGLHKGYDRFQKILSQLNQMQANPDNEDVMIQEITYEDFDQIGKLDLEELDIKWQMAMLSVRINRFEKKAGRKMKFNNRDAARFDKKKVKCYKCSELGHFARECTGKQLDSKARYSAFKLKELDKSE
ncbi:ribonuclease H-like domain-containing protein, partial [Tanacetum coccineum]